LKENDCFRNAMVWSEFGKLDIEGREGAYEKGRVGKGNTAALESNRKNRVEAHQKKVVRKKKNRALATEEAASIKGQRGIRFTRYKQEKGDYSCNHGTKGEATENSSQARGDVASPPRRNIIEKKRTRLGPKRREPSRYQGGAPHEYKGDHHPTPGVFTTGGEAIPLRVEGISEAIYPCRCGGRSLRYRKEEEPSSAGGEKAVKKKKKAG